MHYTQEPSQIEAHDEAEAEVLRLRGGGFVTDAMVVEAFREMRDRPARPNLLIDIRDVAGWDSRAVARAARLLHKAPELGVQRIAFLATSAAVDLATRVASTQTGVPLRTFDHEHSARSWLGIERRPGVR